MDPLLSVGGHWPVQVLTVLSVFSVFSVQVLSVGPTVWVATGQCRCSLVQLFMLLGVTIWLGCSEVMSWTMDMCDCSEQNCSFKTKINVDNNQCSSFQISAMAPFFPLWELCKDGKVDEVSLKTDELNQHYCHPNN